MSEENLALVREAYARWATGDYESLLDFFLTSSAPDVELHSRLGSLSGEPYCGYDGVRTWLAEIEESFECFAPWLDEAHEVGDDRVVALGGISFRPRGSEIDMTQRMGWVQEFRDGQLRRMRFYASPSEALEAVGLQTKS